MTRVREGSLRSSSSASAGSIGSGRSSFKGFLEPYEVGMVASLGRSEELSETSFAM